MSLAARARARRHRAVGRRILSAAILPFCCTDGSRARALQLCECEHKSMFMLPIITANNIKSDAHGNSHI